MKFPRVGSNCTLTSSGLHSSLLSPYNKILSQPSPEFISKPLPLRELNSHVNLLGSNRARTQPPLCLPPEATPSTSQPPTCLADKEFLCSQVWKNTTTLNILLQFPNDLDLPRWQLALITQHWLNMETRGAEILQDNINGKCSWSYKTLHQNCSGLWRILCKPGPPSSSF